MSETHHYFYLHGFASSPRSAKARDLGDRFSAFNIPLVTPDLNQDNFTTLTLTRQIQQVEALLPANAAPVTIIGSSLGGLTAAWLGQKHPQIQRLVLLAPAFNFLDHWLSKLGTAQVQQWQITGFLPVYHYGENRMQLLNYHFVEDAAQYQEADLQRPIPTLILHGNQDEVIPVTASIEFARTRTWVTLRQFPGDHSLINVRDEIWQAVQEYCQIG
jgi:predicted esterase YcpF (UPF0227 family)